MTASLFSLILAASVGALIPHVSSETHARYQYTGWFERDRMTIAVPKSGAHQAWFLIGDDAYNEAELCSDDEAYVCVFSAPYAFAFPRGTERQVPDYWTFRDVTFEVVRRDIELSMLGRKSSGLYLVRTPAEATLGGRQAGKATYTLYSPQYGVLAFGLAPFPDGIPTTVYWQVGDKGFGAIE